MKNVNMYMESLLEEIKGFLINENSKEQDKFVKDYIVSSLQVLKDEKINALEKYSCIIHGLGAFQTYEKYIDNKMLNKEEEPFQDWLVKFENFINEIIK